MEKPYTIMYYGKDNTASYVAELASAGINILSIQSLSNKKCLIIYEFQWKSRNNYIWSKVFGSYEINGADSISDNIIRDVIIARDELERNNELPGYNNGRGNYYYLRVPDGLPPHIKVKNAVEV